MTKNIVSGLILARFGPNLIPQNFLWVLPLADVIHCCNQSMYAISRKTDKPNLRKRQKNLVPGPILVPLVQLEPPKFFSWILPLLDIRQYCKLSLYPISRKTNELNLRKWKKKLVLGLILPHLPKSLAPSVTRYHGQQNIRKT